jgi:mono/diheme cytochrome c family protein
MRFSKTLGLLAAIVLGVMIFECGLGPGSAKAQSTAEPSRPAKPGAPADDLQRSVRIFNYTMVATSGAQRGEVIYFYKCWMCHNKYTKSAPYLKDLFQRSKLVSGQPVNDQTVTDMIKNGSPRMPAFRYTLSDADLADVLSYFRGGKCCYEEDDPPLNPWYHKP